MKNKICTYEGQKVYGVRALGPKVNIKCNREKNENHYSKEPDMEVILYLAQIILVKLEILIQMKIPGLME
jgi:hypothetical protein